MAASVDELRARLEAVNRVRFSTTIRREFDVATRSARDLERQIERLENHGQRSERSAFGLPAGLLRGLSAGAAVAGGVAAFQQAATTQGVQNAIDFSVGSKQTGAADTRFITALSDKLGLSQEAGLEGFKMFAGSTRNMANDQRLNIYQGVSEASAAFHLDGETQKGVYLALSQMASKGKVAAEELRGQLGERLPGAFKLAAESIGVTESKLNDMLQAGDVVASDFLPKFGAKLHEVFGQVAVQNADSAQSNINRLYNAIFQLKNSIGNDLTPAGIDLIKNFLIPAAHAAADLFKVVMQVGGGIAWYITQLKEGNPTIILATGIVLAFAAAIAYNTLLMEGISIATRLWAGAQLILNVIMSLNPIVLIIGLIIALGAWIYFIIQKYDGWGKSLQGLWEIIKGFAKIVWISFKDMGENIWYWIQFAWLKMKSFVEYIGIAIEHVMTALKLASEFKFGEAKAALTAEIKTQASAELDALQKQHTQDRLKNMQDAQEAASQIIKGWNQIGLHENKKAKKVDPTGLVGGGTASAGVGAGSTDTADASNTASSINKGGQRSVVINIGKQIERLDVHVMGKEEAGREIADIVREEMRRVYYSLAGEATTA